MFKKISISLLLILNINASEIDELSLELNKIYNNFPYITKEIKQDQDEFIKTINECKDDNNCIKTLYKTRIKELNTSLENSKTYPKELIEHIKIIQENSTNCNKNKCTTIDCEGITIDNFWQDFFRYKDVKIKPKIVDAKPYSSKEVKDTLKYCWDLGLDRKVVNYQEPADTVYSFVEVDKDGEPYFASKIKGKKYIKRHKNITISEMVVYNEHYLVISGEYGDLLFLYKDFCNGPMEDNNLLELFENYKAIQMSNCFREYAKNTFIIYYKGDDYILSYNRYNAYYSISINSMYDTMSSLYTSFESCSYLARKIESLRCEINLTKEN